MTKEIMALLEMRETKIVDKHRFKKHDEKKKKCV